MAVAARNADKVLGAYVYALGSHWWRGNSAIFRAAQITRKAKAAITVVLSYPVTSKLLAMSAIFSEPVAW